MKIIRCITVVPIGMIHVAISAVLLFPLMAIMFGIDKANKFMDGICINYIELFK